MTITNFVSSVLVARQLAPSSDGSPGATGEFDLDRNGKIIWAAWDDDRGPFSIAANDSASNDGSDPHMFFGYNLLPRALLINEDDRGLAFGIEADYLEPSLGHKTMEWYIQYQKASGFQTGDDANYVRQLFGQIDKVTNLPNTLNFASAGIGTKFGWVDGTGTEEEQAVGKTQAWLYKQWFIVYAAPGSSNPAFTVDFQTANSATGIYSSSRAAGAGHHITTTSTASDEALYIGAKGANGPLVLNYDDNGPILFPNGSASKPSLSFINDQDCGAWLIGTNNIGIGVAATKILDIATTGLSVTGLLSASGGIGYAPGLGGSTTQPSSSGKASSVTLNKLSGEITLDSANLAANAVVGFTFNNSTIAATDMLDINVVSGTNGGYYVGARCVAGGASVFVRNLTAGTLGEAVVLRYNVQKATKT